MTQGGCVGERVTKDPVRHTGGSPDGLAGRGDQGAVGNRWYRSSPGEFEIVQDDGSKAHLVAGKACMIEPGHDARVVGDESVVGLEFDTLAAESYGKG